MTAKGWSVTLSLASLGFAIQYQHSAYFLLASISAVSFWAIEALMKGQQIRYYGRMREIEVDSYHLNRVDVGGTKVSAPRTDWSWDNFGKSQTKSGQPIGSEPKPRDLDRARRDRWRIALWPHVCLPHFVAAAAGMTLLLLSITGVFGMKL
jgi:hypothetical protein